jgi:Flp pilus assembly protein TadB
MIILGCISAIAIGVFLVDATQRRSADSSISEKLTTEEAALRRPLEPASSAKRRRHATWVLSGIAFVAVRQLLGLSAGVVEIGFFAMGALAGEMALRVRQESALKRRLRRTEFHLPNVMERVVMAVSAGLDVVPALQEASRSSDDPVSDIMREVVQLAEGGMPVSDALSAASEKTASISLKHALVHLGIAHQQGGEIVRPLKELSDATQTHFQEVVEEQIAKLPVQAVMPLVVTFAGLIICFLTIPLMQVGSITRRVAHVAQQH